MGVSEPVRSQGAEKMGASEPVRYQDVRKWVFLNQFDLKKCHFISVRYLKILKIMV